MKKVTNILYWAVMFILVFWFAYTKGWIFTSFKSIDAQKAIALLKRDSNLTLLDVRTIEEYKKGHLENTTLIPLQVLEKNITMLEASKHKKVMVYCASGNRSVIASRILQKYGFLPINIKGGIIQLMKEGAILTK